MATSGGDASFGVTLRRCWQAATSRRSRRSHSARTRIPARLGSITWPVTPRKGAACRYKGATRETCQERRGNRGCRRTRRSDLVATTEHVRGAGARWGTSVCSLARALRPESCNTRCRRLMWRPHDSAGRGTCCGTRCAVRHSACGTTEGDWCSWIHARRAPHVTTSGPERSVTLLLRGVREHTNCAARSGFPFNPTGTRATPSPAAATPEGEAES